MDSLAPGPAEYVAFLNGITMTSWHVENKNLLLVILCKVNYMHILSKSAGL